MKNALHLMTLVVAIGAMGCLNERVYVDPNSNAGFQGGTPSDLELRDAQLRGDFGPRRGFDGSATDVQGSSDPEWSTSTVTVTRDQQDVGTGMVIIWTNGVVLEDLQLGSHDFRYDPSSLDAPLVSVNGCSGPSMQAIDYDRPADRVTVDVAQSPEGGRIYEFQTETDIVDLRTDTVTGVETSHTTFTLAQRG